MNRLAVTVLVVMLASAVSLPGTAGAAPRRADDPRVADAARAWEEWVEYQVGMKDTFTEVPQDLRGGRLAVGHSARRRDEELDRYVGVYGSIRGESAIRRWEDGLAELWLATRDPAEALTRLKKTGEHTSRRIRGGDEELGETFLLEIGEDGTARRCQRHSNWNVRVR